jgi:hypothetical protein
MSAYLHAYIDTWIFFVVCKHTCEIEGSSGNGRARNKRVVITHLNAYGFFYGLPKTTLMFLIKYFFFTPREVNTLSPYVCYLHINKLAVCIERTFSFLRVREFKFMLA